eukprot:jgi/Mesen1/1215/ME000129S00317
MTMFSSPCDLGLLDKVFGPATPTRSVYDQAAQPVVSAAMEGINGTVFAYGVTSSGKTHTMHGDKKSPGIIPLAVKEVFSIIQEVSCMSCFTSSSHLLFATLESARALRSCESCYLSPRLGSPRFRLAFISCLH